MIISMSKKRKYDESSIQFRFDFAVMDSVDKPKCISLLINLKFGKLC